MAQIVTITFNPCIDKSFSTATIVPDRKLACSLPRIDPGGGGINVARAVKRLGGSAMAVYPAGGPGGQLLTRLLNDEQVPVNPIWMAGDIRENINVTESSTNRQFRFIVQGPALNDTVWSQCLTALSTVEEGGYIVVSGSLPEPWPQDIFLRIKKIADARRAQLVVDTSGKALLTAVQCGVHWLKPSLRELDALAEALRLPAGERVGMARHLTRDGSVQGVVFSAGPNGATLVTKDQTIEFQAPEVSKISTVGAGDSLVAGIVLGLSRGMAAADAVKYGVACGTAAVLNPGTSLCHPEDVDRLYHRVRRLVPA